MISSAPYPEVKPGKGNSGTTMISAAPYPEVKAGNARTIDGRHQFAVINLHDPGNSSGGVILQSKQHWERVYSSKAPDSVSWYQQHAQASLRLIEFIELRSTAPIIDVGGGASTLTDDLIARGFSNLTVLDLSAAALAAARARLGERGEKVCWLEADIRSARLPREAFELWHDRAVFHFLTEADDRTAYLRNVNHSVRGGGHVIVATFAEDGPSRCSGLPVMRYGADELHAAFGENYRRVTCEKEIHRTPGGAEQRFTWCCFRKI